MMRSMRWMGVALALATGMPVLGFADETTQIHRGKKSAVHVQRSSHDGAKQQQQRARPSKAELEQLEEQIRQKQAAEARRSFERLVRKYPAWHPSDALLDRLSGIEALVKGEEEIWKLLGEGRVAEAQSAMQRLEERVPGWKPSRKMLQVAKIAAAEPELWDFLHEGDLDAIERRLKELESIAPDWQPSAAFRKELRKARVDAELEKAWRAKDWKGIVGLYRKAPDLFDCSGQHRRLKLAEAYLRLGNEEQAARAFASGFDHCKEYLNLEALEYAASRLPPARLGELIAEVRRRPLSAAGRRRVALVEFRHLNSGNLDPVDRARRLREIENSLLARPEPGLVRALGWAYLEAGMSEDALRMFRRARSIRDTAEARKGEIMALHRLQKWQEVRMRIQQGRSMLEGAGVLPDVLPLLADACTHLGDDACVVRSFTQLDRTQSLSPEQRIVLGWAQYRQGRAKDAAVSFERAYRAQPSTEAAEGLRLSLLAAGEPLKLSRLARELDGPLAAEHGRQVAQRFYDTGLYHAALAAGSTVPELKGADSDRVSAGWSYRHVSANLLTPALDQLTLYSWSLTGDRFLRPDRWLELRIDRIRLDAGPPLLLPTDHVGTAVVAPPVVYPVQTRWTGYEWDIGLRHQGWTSWQIRIGQGFRGGPLAPDWKGLLQLDRRFDIGWLNLEAHRQPLRSTMLSYIGLQAPQAPIVWGRVSRTGAGLSAYLDTGLPRLGLYAGLGADVFTGRQVASNTGFYANLSLPVHLGQGGWRLDLAPMGTLMRYRHDRNHFTVGHGGYFSPQRYHLVGLYADIGRGAPGDRFHVRFKGLWGRQSYYQEAAPRLPLSPNALPPFLPQRVNSMVLDGRIEFALMLGDHWRLAGILRSSRSEHFVLGVRQFYRNQEAVLTLTWNRDARAGLLDDDPPSFGIDHLE